MDKSLAGLGVLITRPTHQAEGLCAAIAAHGGRPLLFPSLIIAPPSQPALMKAAIGGLANIDYIIFTSANAVHHVQASLSAQQLVLMNRGKIFSVGPATRTALLAAKLPSVIMPEDDFSSEGLLALPALNSVKDKRIIIFTGEDSRDLLADMLRVRAAKVCVVPTYRRLRPNVPVAPLLDKWRRGKVDLVVSTSANSLRNLLLMLGDEGEKFLRNTPLAVVSERMLALAESLTWFAPILVAKDASDAAILALLSDYVKRRNT